MPLIWSYCKIVWVQTDVWFVKCCFEWDEVMILIHFLLNAHKIGTFLICVFDHPSQSGFSYLRYQLLNLSKWSFTQEGGCVTSYKCLLVSSAYDANIRSPANNSKMDKLLHNYLERKYQEINFYFNC